MDYEGSGPACCVLTSRPPVLLLAVLTAAVLILSSAYAEVAAFTSRAESRTIGSVDVTTGGQPTVTPGGSPTVTPENQLLQGAGGVSYALVNPVHTVPLPHIEVSVDGFLITPSTGPSIIMELSTLEQPNRLKLDGQAVYADGTVDSSETVEFSLVPNTAKDEFLANHGEVTCGQ